MGRGGSIGTKLVADSEGGFWSSHDEESVSRVVGMTGSVGCDGRTRDVHLDCVPAEEAANLNEVVLVHPRLEVTKEEGGILWEVVVCDFDARASGRRGSGWAAVDVVGVSERLWSRRSSVNVR